MKFLIVLIVLIVLSGCTALSTPVVIEKRVANIPIFHPPMPDGVKWDDFEWTVWTSKEMRKYLESLDEGKAPKIAMYWISPKGYETLSGNMAEIKRILKSNKKQLIYYRNLDKKMPQ